MTRIESRAAAAAALGLLGAAHLVFWAVVGRWGLPGAAAFFAALAAAGAWCWHLAATAEARRWRRFIRRFPRPVRAAVTTVLDTESSVAAWRTAGLTAPAVCSGYRDHGVWPLWIGAAVRITRRPGHSPAAYRAAAVQLAATLGVREVRVVKVTENAILLHLVTRDPASSSA